MDDFNNKKLIQKEALKVVKDYLKGLAFSDRKVTDTPTDALSVVNRKFVTANGVTADIPPTSVTGQFYYNTSTNIPMWWDGTKWRNGVGSVVA